MWNINTNIQHTSPYILHKDEKTTMYQKKLIIQVQCLLKLLKKMAAVPTTFFNKAPEV